MKKGSKLYNDYVNILKDELLPAMGCTEPIAISYLAYKAKEILNDIPSSVTLEVCGNIIKNVKSVVVPQTGGLKGIETAVAAGFYGETKDSKLEVLSTIDDEKRVLINDYLAKDIIQIIPSKKPYRFYLKIMVSNGVDTVMVEVLNSHTNIIKIEKNDVVLYEIDKKIEEEKNKTFEGLSVEKIVKFADIVDLDLLRDVLKRQIEYNLKIAEVGLNEEYGANIGKVLLKTYDNDVNTKAKAYAAAASDARMSGCALPVIIISGSGNQGIAASLPVYIFAQELKKSEDEMLRALIVSDLVTLKQKKDIGRLSAFCGATVAGIGAAAGVAYLKNGSFHAIAHTIVNALGIISGMVCDGAKPSCAAKISAAVDAGLFGYYMYENNQQFRSGEGIITKGVDSTIENVGKMAKYGMDKTDDEILKIMTGYSCVD